MEKFYNFNTKSKKYGRLQSVSTGGKKIMEITRETVCFTNMCMVQDQEGNIAALDKKAGSYTGLTFPGGHLEEGETFCEAVIREVREEAGLEIRNPVFCGIYHWHENGIHNVIFLYRTTEYTGELKGSEEGDVFWMPLAEFRSRELAQGMEEVLAIVQDASAQECYMKWENDAYRQYLY